MRIRNLTILVLAGLLLSGCYTSSLTVLGPATGIVHGKTAESVASTSLNYLIKEETGKSPIEHVLTKQQQAYYEKKKRELNPCVINPGLCLSIKSRVAENHKKLLGLNLEARINKVREKIIKQNP